MSMNNVFREKLVFKYFYFFFDDSDDIPSWYFWVHYVLEKGSRELL